MTTKYFPLFLIIIFIGAGWSSYALGQIIPRFGIDLVNQDINLMKETGANLYRSYPIRWGGIEKYQPGSSEIQQNLVQNPSYQEIVYDFDNVAHFFDWSSTDIDAAIYHGTRVDDNITLFFSVHETSPWASNEICVAKKYDAITQAVKDFKINCPLKDETSLKHFKFYVQKLIERYDYDGINDMPGLKKEVIFWQLGAEYNALDYWDGTNNEYFLLWSAFIQSARAASNKIVIVSNGISNIQENRNAMYNGSFHAGMAFQVIYDSSYSSILTQEENARVNNILNNPLVYPTINDVMGYLALSSQTKNNLVQSALENRKKSVEFVIMIFNYPELYDIYDARMYTYYKYQQNRISEDIAFIKLNMSQRGYSRPIMPTEGSGAFLGEQGGMPDPERSNFISLVKSYIDKKIIKINNNAVTQEETQSYNYYIAEQARDLIKLYTALFSEGASSFVWYKFRDITNVNNYEFESPFRINGLLYQFEGVLKKPVFYSYAIMTSKLQGFNSARKIAPQQIEFMFTNKNPIYVLWSEQGATTANLSAYIFSPSVKITYIVTETDGNGAPIYRNDEIVAVNSIPITETPIFVEMIQDTIPPSAPTGLVVN